MKNPGNTELELKKSQELLQSVFDASPSSITVLQPIYSGETVEDFLIIAANKKVIEINKGINPVGHRYSQFYYKATETYAWQVFMQVIVTGVTTDFETYYKSESIDGWYRVIVVKEKGNLIISGEEISKRKTSEKQFGDTLKLLELKNKIYAYAEDIAHMGTWTWDPQTNDAVYSDNMFLLFGLKPGEIKPTFETIPSFVHPEDRQRLLDGAMHIKEGGRPVGVEYRITRKDGAERIFVNRMKKEGNIFFGITEDITERKNAERELLEVKDSLAQQAANKYMTLFNSIDEGLCILEVIFDENKKPVDYRFIEMNPAFEKHTGVKGGLGKTILQLVPEMEPVWPENYGHVALSGEPIRFENYFKSLNRWFDVYAFRIDQPGDNHVAVLFTDITERKNAEELLRQSEEKKAYLLKLSDAIRLLADPEEIQYQASCTLGRYLGANRVGYAEDGNDCEQVTVMRNYTDGVPGIEGTYRYDDYGKTLMADLCAGRTVVRNDIVNDPSLTETEKEAHRKLQIGATVNIPLVKGDKLVAILFVHYNEAHHWSAGELALLEETAQRTWAAVEQAKAEKALRRSEEVYRDKLVEEVKQRTYELNESKELLQNVFDDSPNSIAVFENIYNEDNKVVDFAARMMNLVMIHTLARPDWMGKRYTVLFPHARENGLLDKMLAVANTGKSADFEQAIDVNDTFLWYRYIMNKVGSLLMVTSEDITERKEAERSVIDLKLRQQKEILNAIIATQEEERERIGENLHNGVAQLLYAIQTRLDLLTGSEADKVQIQNISNIVKQAIEDTRQISFELVPSVLKDYGIEVAVKSLYRRIANDRLQVEFQFGKLLKRLPEKIEFASYRIIQELLNNIIKHSGATQALISMGTRKNSLHLDVYDNGVGFDEKLLDPMDKGIGLQNIKNRVSLLDGSLSITSTQGRTHFAIVIPFEEPANNNS